jgi:hypothetical protein
LNLTKSNPKPNEEEPKPQPRKTRMPKKENFNLSRRNHNPTKRKLNAKNKRIKKHYTKTKTQIRGNEIPKKMNPNVHYYKRGVQFSGLNHYGTLKVK